MAWEFNACAKEMWKRGVAYQQLGQSYADTGETRSARTMLQTGVKKASAAGDGHAAAEMQQMLDSLGS
jgi:hypothetical protein